MTPRQVAGIADHDQQSAELWSVLREHYRNDPRHARLMAGDCMDYLVRLGSHADGNQKQDASLAARLGMIGLFNLFEKIAEWDAELEEESNECR